MKKRRLLLLMYNYLLPNRIIRLILKEIILEIQTKAVGDSKMTNK